MGLSNTFFGMFVLTVGMAVFVFLALWALESRGYKILGGVVSAIIFLMMLCPLQKKYREEHPIAELQILGPGDMPIRTYEILGEKVKKELAYRSVYAVGVINVSRKRTIRNVSIKEIFIGEPFELKVLGSTQAVADIRPGDAAYYEIGALYSTAPISLVGLTKISEKKFDRVNAYAQARVYVTASNGIIPTTLINENGAQVQRKGAPYTFSYYQLISDDSEPVEVKISMSSNKNRYVRFESIPLEN